jgi:hypothetical protein
MLLHSVVSFCFRIVLKRVLVISEWIQRKVNFVYVYHIHGGNAVSYFCGSHTSQQEYRKLISILGQI